MLRTYVPLPRWMVRESYPRSMSVWINSSESMASTSASNDVVPTVTNTLFFSFLLLLHLLLSDIFGLVQLLFFCVLASVEKKCAKKLNTKKTKKKTPCFPITPLCCVRMCQPPFKPPSCRGKRQRMTVFLITKKTR